MTERVTEPLRGQRIETASWAFGNSGTRFKVFPQEGVPRTPYEKIEDAATVHRFTGVAPSVALHIPWDAVDDYADLAAFAAELLAPTLVAPATLAEATAEQFPGLAGVVPGLGSFDPNPWGLGFEIRGDKSPHWTATSGSPRTFGHFGGAGTFLWVDPDAMPSQRVEITDDFGQRIQMSLAQLANIVDDAKQGALDGLLRGTGQAIVESDDLE